MGLVHRRKTGIRLRCAVAAVFAVCAFPAVAQGTTVVSYASGSGLMVVSGGERNRIFVAFGSSGGGTYAVNEGPRPDFTAVPVTAGEGCSADGADRAICQRSGVSVMTIKAGGGDDRVLIDCSAPPDALGDAFIDGGDGSDHLAGGLGFDAIDGGDGNDTLTDCGGNDTLNAGAGDDTVSGGPGNDTLNGGAGDDSLSNSADGVDVLSGGPGVDTVVTGSALDAGKQHNYSLDDVANDSDGEDTGENLKSDIENVTLPESDSTRDVISGGPGANRLEGGGGNDTLSGGTPATTSTFTVQSTPITVRLLTLASADDVLLGDSGDDTLNGQGGADQLDGGTGVDVLNGGAGGDTILARDSITDTIACGTDTDNADLDLRDPEPSGCENIDRGAVEEGYNLGIPTGAVTRSPDRVAVRIACHRTVSRGCRGRLAVKAPGARRHGGASKAVHYALRRGKARSIRIRLPARSQRTLARHHRVTVTLQSVEHGSFGLKTTIRQLEVRLRR
jgi:Ca2+-binding RTX toxin-like protein